MLCCSMCHRVFHFTCYEEKLGNRTKNSNKKEVTDKKDGKVTTVNEGDVSSSAEKAVPTFCSVCQLLQDEKECPVDRDMLNYLLSFTLNRIRIWVSHLLVILSLFSYVISVYYIITRLYNWKSLLYPKI